MTNESKATTYRGASARAFDRAAPLYDADHSQNWVARWSRAQSLRVLDAAFQPGQRVLELGCGTGDEAIHLARRGVYVLATDAAPLMVEQVRRKLSPGGQAAAVRERIETKVMPAGQLVGLVERYGPAYFDGAFSSFGPLNCEPLLEPVAEGLAALVRPGGRVVISLINRYCIWETLWYLAARKPRLAFRRWPGRALATVRGEWQDERIPVSYWTPKAVEKRFEAHFRTVRRMALPWLLPPQYLDGLVRRAPGLFRWLARMDRLQAERWPMYMVGDHILLELARVDE